VASNSHVSCSSSAVFQNQGGRGRLLMCSCYVCRRSICRSGDGVAHKFLAAVRLVMPPKTTKATRPGGHAIAAAPHSMRGAPFTVSGFRRMVERAALAAGLESVKVHPHMLRHACGYALANRGVDTRTLQAYLGHCNIANTVKYTELSATRFKGLWKD
jgi:site-specific recombinase XerD